MKIIAVIAAAAAAFGFHAAAQADAGRVGITFDPFTGLDGTVGRWVTDNNFSGGVSAVHNEGGADESRAEQFFGSYEPGVPTTVGPPFPGFGTAITQTSAGYPIQGSAGLDGLTLQAAWARSNIQQDFVSAGVGWSRSFMLNPNASFTFSGLTDFIHPSNEVPVMVHDEYPYPPPLSTMVEQAYLHIGAYHVFANEITMGLQVLNVDPNGPEDLLLGRTADDSHFSYDYDSFGRLSLTIHNDSAQVLFGNFSIGVHAATPLVPEPATWALLLAGFLLVVLMPRRRS